MKFFFAQFFGFVALILSCDAVFKQDKKTFFIIEAFVDIFYALSYFMLGVHLPGILSILSMIAMMSIFYLQKKQNKIDFFILILFIFLQVLMGVIYFDNWTTIFPVLASIMFAIGFYLKNLQVTRILIAIPNFIFIIYNFYCMAYTNAILDIIETVAVVWAIVKFYLSKKLKVQTASLCIFSDKKMFLNKNI